MIDNSQDQIKKIHVPWNDPFASDEDDALIDIPIGIPWIKVSLWLWTAICMGGFFCARYISDSILPTVLINGITLDLFYKEIDFTPIQYDILSKIIFPLLKGIVIGLIMGIFQYRLLKLLGIKGATGIITNILLWAFVFSPMKGDTVFSFQFWIINIILMIVVMTTYTHLVGRMVRSPYLWGLGGTSGFILMYLQIFSVIMTM